MNEGYETKPIRTIEPDSAISPLLELRNIWRHRELLYLLAWRDYKVRYRQTAIGIAWAVFQPLMAMITFVLIFGRFKEITDNGVPYALFVYSGLTVWQFFSNSITDASASLVASSQMITKIYFPRIIIPLAKIVTQLINLFFSLIILVGLMIFFHVHPPLLGILYIIPIFLLLGLVSASIGIALSAVNVRFRDVQYILPYFIQLGLFFSPVIYAGSSLGKYQGFLLLNPITGIIDAFRSILFGSSFNIQSFIVSCMISLLLFIGGMYYFIKAEGKFSDVI